MAMVFSVSAGMRPFGAKHAAELSEPNRQNKALSPFDIWILLSRTDEFAFPVQRILAALGFIPVFLGKLN